MEVQVEVEAVNPNTKERRKVASSYLVYVRLGPDGRPGVVPPWAPQTEAQKQRAEYADIRRELRREEAAQAKALEQEPSAGTGPLSVAPFSVPASVKDALDTLLNQFQRK